MWGAGERGRLGRCRAWAGNVLGGEVSVWFRGGKEETFTGSVPSFGDLMILFTYRLIDGPDVVGEQCDHGVGGCVVVADGVPVGWVFGGLSVTFVLWLVRGVDRYVQEWCRRLVVVVGVCEELLGEVVGLGRGGGGGTRGRGGRLGLRWGGWGGYAVEVFEGVVWIEVMEFESAHSNTTAKLPILKLENGKSWVSVPQTAQENGTSVTKMSVPVTAKEKTNKKNDVKARSLLLMALPNEHQLTFSQYTNAKTIASSVESLDSIFNRLQKIFSRLAILGVVITQEDLNLKFLRSLPPEWNTHVVVWMNKAKIETMSIDDLYNNFKIVEQSVKKSVGASSGAQNLAFMTTSSTSSTNDVNTAKPAYEVSTVSSNVNTVSPQVSTASFSDNDVYDFMVENPNGSNLLQHDLEQIHEDDLEAMGLKALRNKEGQFRNQDNTRKQGNNEDTSSKAMLAIDGVVLKREVACKDYEINVLKSEFEKVKQEKEGIEFKIEKFDNASKSLNKLLESQITDKSKKGLGYNVVPPPHPLIYNRPKKLDLSYSGLDEFKDPEFKSYGSEDSKQESNIVCDKKSDASKENSDDSLVKEKVSVSKDQVAWLCLLLNVDK
ncbi:hypothetical protein Tco_0664643 [Tanacetum coccineum]